MAKPILATTPLSYNEISSLAQLFSSAFLRLNESGIPSKQAQQKRLFFQNVHTVVGLTFTAVVVEQDSLPLFRPYLNDFLRHRANDGDMYTSGMAGIAMGDIISLGSDAFRTIEHPKYYSYFLQALRDCLRYSITELNMPLSLGLETVLGLIGIDE